jgi:hypothetical protein
VRSRLMLESGGRAIVAGATTTPRGVNEKTSQLLAMLVDFWICVGADRFVGNAASTLSRNVCYIRRARGKLIDPSDCMFVIRAPIK